MFEWQRCCFYTGVERTAKDVSGAMWMKAGNGWCSPFGYGKRRRISVGVHYFAAPAAFHRRASAGSEGALFSVCPQCTCT